LYAWNANRIRVRVGRFAAASVDARFISFEAENVSGTKTSMEPVFTLTAYTPQRERQTSAPTASRRIRASRARTSLFAAASSDAARRNSVRTRLLLIERSRVTIPMKTLRMLIRIQSREPESIHIVPGRRLEQTLANFHSRPVADGRSSNLGPPKLPLIASTTE
jgi:hypothetical protein